MRLHILGAGSLGLLWAARLARRRVPVTLLLRDRAALEQWSARGGQVHLQEGELTSAFPLAAQRIEDAESIDCLILATKAYAATQALEAAIPRLAPDGTVVMLQNGMAAQCQAKALWPDRRILFASVTDGAWLAAPGHVVWAGHGPTRVGDPAGGPLPGCLRALERAEFDWQWETDIESVLWHKLAINCAINPLSILFDCPNGQVESRAGARFGQIVDELEQLLDRVGAPLPPGELDCRLRDVIRRTAANSSSMRQDVAAGRRTEIDFILGHACRHARAVGLSVPVLDRLLGDVQQLLAGRGLPTD